MTFQKLPNLIIAGVNKAGTTSLHTYLSWHPDICGSKEKETNYFVPILYNRKLSPIENYAKFFQSCDDQSKYLIESTPRYIYGGEKMAIAIHETLGPIKIIFIFRDPIQRLFSYYRHMKDSGEIPESEYFDEYVNKSLKGYNEIRNKYKIIDVYKENVYFRGLVQGFYSDYLIEWYKVFGNSIKIFFFEDIKTNPAKFMTIICSWLEINPVIYESAKFTVENKRINYKSKMLHQLASLVNNKFESFFRTYYPIKETLRNIYYFINESANNKESISEESMCNLGLVYDKYNRQLFDILASKGHTDFPGWF